MALLKICESDSLVEFLRATYDAIPLRVPDTRVKPLVLFTTRGRRIRFLGPLADLSEPGKWHEPELENSDIADVRNTSSSQHRWGIIADFLPPFLSALLQLSALDIAASIKVAGIGNERVSVSLGRTKRFFVHPITCATLLQNVDLRLPSSFGFELGRQSSAPLFLVDCVLKAREIHLEIGKGKSFETAVKLHADLLAKVSPEQVLKRENRLTVTGAKPLTFAFTCLQLDVRKNGAIRNIKVPPGKSFFGATGSSKAAAIYHPHVGNAMELFAFDE